MIETNRIILKSNKEMEPIMALFTIVANVKKD